MWIYLPEPGYSYFLIKFEPPIFLVTIWIGPKYRLIILHNNILITYKWNHGI